MRYTLRKEAELHAKALCPKGWKYQVWENIGWHVRWMKGPISVRECAGWKCEREFNAMISSNEEYDGSGGPWTSYWKSEIAPGPHFSVLDAAQAEVRCFIAYVKDQREIFERVEGSIPKMFLPEAEETNA